MTLARDRRRVHRRTSALVVLALALAVTLAIAVASSPSPAWSQDRGRCATIEAPWPIVLPDGSIHEAGPVKLCLQQMWTSVTGLHEIRVNDASVGLFMSRVGQSETLASRAPLVVFHRDGTDERYLVGYAWPQGDTMRTYTLREFGRVAEETAQNSILPLLDSPDETILVAALPH